MRVCLPALVGLILCCGCASTGGLANVTVPVAVARGEAIWIQVEDRDPVERAPVFAPRTERVWWQKMPLVGDTLSWVLGLKTAGETLETVSGDVVSTKVNTRYVRLSIGTDKPFERCELKGLTVGRARFGEFVMTRPVAASRPAPAEDPVEGE